MYHSIWIIGDHFLKEALQPLFDMRNHTVKQDKLLPYLFRHYNVSGHHPTSAAVHNVITRFLNTFVEALNEHNLLPKFIIIVPDKDLLTGQNSKTEVSIMIGVILHHLIKQMDIYIEHRKADLLEKCPGEVIDDEYPKLIWVHMMKRPKNLSPEFNHIFALRGKFNAILEERLMDGKAENHYIMSTEVYLNEFNFTGGLSAAGITHFWEEINKGMKRFDKDQITLKPHQKVGTAEQNKLAELKFKRKFPTPPPPNRREACNGDCHDHHNSTSSKERRSDSREHNHCRR